MNNLLSYCGLVDPRLSASDKDLPVKKNLLNDGTKKLKRGRCDPLTYLEETYGALPQTYECSLCGRNCQDEKKYNLHLLGKFYKVLFVM